MIYSLNDLEKKYICITSNTRMKRFMIVSEQAINHLIISKYDFSGKTFKF